MHEVSICQEIMQLSILNAILATRNSAFFFAIWREKISERISDEVNHQEVIGLAYNKQESTRREGNIEGGDGGRA